MFPPGVKTHTYTQTAHTQASSSQCNYGETEQSVTHLSAARIRAGCYSDTDGESWELSLLKHNDRQLHLRPWPSTQTKYSEQRTTEKDEVEHEDDAY